MVLGAVAPAAHSAVGTAMGWTRDFIGEGSKRRKTIGRAGTKLANLVGQMEKEKEKEHRAGWAKLFSKL